MVRIQRIETIIWGGETSDGGSESRKTEIKRPYDLFLMHKHVCSEKFLTSGVRLHHTCNILI